MNPSKSSITYDLIAHKDGETRGFTKVVWDLLPPNKNGWKIGNTEKPKKKVSKKVVPKKQAPIETLSSVDFNVSDLGEQLKKFDSVKEIETFIGDDKRAGAKKMATLRINELSK